MDAQQQQQQQQQAQDQPQQLRPVLRGLHEVENETGKVVWEGCWCMREVDFGVPGCTAPFRYERTGKYEPEGGKGGKQETGMDDGLYSGFFMVNGPNNTSSKITEKNVLIQFEVSMEQGEEDLLKVAGSGSNKLGKFTLTGTYDKKTKQMLVVREYAIKKKTRRNMVSHARVVRELDLVSSAPKQNSSSSLLVDDDEQTATNVNLVLDNLAKILEELMKADKEKWFCVPVDAEALGLKDYNIIITQPMDLGTVKQKFTQGEYVAPQAMRDDIELTFGNAIHYNPRGTVVYKRAVELQTLFKKRYDKLMRKSIASEIRTPDAPPSIRKIGKRNSVKKIMFEPDADQPQQLTADYDDRKRKRKSSSPRSSSIEEDELEIDRLQTQIRQMSENIAKLQRTMSKNESMFKKPRLPPQPVTYEQKQKLGRDINFLPAEKLGRVVEIIEQAGFTLPVSSSGDVELDIDMLNDDTIRKLRNFVSRHAVKPVGATNALDQMDLPF